MSANCRPREICSKLVVDFGALGVQLPELFRFESEGMNRKEMESRLENIIKTLPDDELGRILKILRALYPVQ